MLRKVNYRALGLEAQKSLYLTLTVRLQSLTAWSHGELELEKALESSQPGAAPFPMAGGSSPHGVWTSWTQQQGQSCFC